MRRFIEFIFLAQHLQVLQYIMGKKIKIYLYYIFVRYLNCSFVIIYLFCCFQIFLSRSSKSGLFICLVGDTAVGKTSILLRIIEGSFKEYITSTVGQDYKSQIKSINGQDVQVQLWDTSGQEKYRSVTKNAFRNCDGIFIVFSMADEKSVKGLEYWASQVNDIIDPLVPKIILGNKCDVKQVSEQTNRIMSKLQEEDNFKFYKVSAKTGKNIKQAYEQLLNQSYQYMMTYRIRQIIPKPKKEKGCC